MIRIQKLGLYEGDPPRLFLHASLRARAKLELKFHREKSLKHAGIFRPVPSVQITLKELREIRPQVHTLCDGGFSKVMITLFSTKYSDGRMRYTSCTSYSCVVHTFSVRQTRKSVIKFSSLL